MLIQFFQIFQGLYTLFLEDPVIAGARIFLILLAFLLIYLGYRQVLEPLMMIPMGIGMLGVNAGVLILEASQHGTLFLAPLAASTEQILYALQINFLQPIYNFTFSNGLIACLVFMGIGAITDIDFFMAKPFMSIIIAIFAELGTIATFPIAQAFGLAPNEAAAIALVGGADGPMVLYGSIMLARNLFVPITIIAYLYLSLTYAGYPYLIKLMIPKRMRAVRMNPAEIKRVPSSQKFAFTIITVTVLSLLFPVAAPLYASFFVGLAVKEMNIKRYVEVLSGPVLYGATFFLAFTLGALLEANTILDPVVLKLLILGIIALLLSGIGGIIGGMVFYKIRKGKFNPIIGIAGVSCVPTTAKVAQHAAYEANKMNMILPFAMGPNVAGVITTSIITGIYVSVLGLL
ncbi:MAG: sodium ion-translocating decarboxylase subunit beta [Chloroflexota bacterium]